ncbi:LHCA8 [Auxenochlorella protothecoides x Auxenochlorella symbiontica]
MPDRLGPLSGCMRRRGPCGSRGPKPPPTSMDPCQESNYGFDPLSLGVNKKALDWFRNAELYNGRWAMLGVAGILIPGLLTKIGILNVPEWYDAGLVSQQNSPIPFKPLLLIELFAFNFVELKRLKDIQKPGSQGEPGSFLGFEGQFKGTGVSGYPGHIFDPLGFSNTSEANLNELKLKEIKNGRLAMLAFLGFVAQAKATGKGPITNLFEHIGDPWHNNFTTNGASLPIDVFA